MSYLFIIGIIAIFTLILCFVIGYDIGKIVQRRENESKQVQK